MITQLYDNMEDYIIVNTCHATVVGIKNIHSCVCIGDIELSPCYFYVFELSPYRFICSSCVFVVAHERVEYFVKTFQHIIYYFTSLSLAFGPSEMYAIKQVWTDVRIKGGRFHLGQSWWRTIHSDVRFV